MKKFMFLLVAALMSTAMSFGQNTLVATLDHGGEISVFYGSSALINAYNAADHGDVITLSSGVFDVPVFSKAITIRGAGMHYNQTAQTDYSFLTAAHEYQAYNRYIMIDSEALEQVEGNLIFEGVRFDQFGKQGNYQNGSERALAITKTQFIRCFFTNLALSSYIESNCTFINCRFSNSLASYGNENVTCLNCLINSLTASRGNYKNCVIDKMSIENATYVYMENCCFLSPEAIRSFPNSATLMNCVSPTSNTFSNVSNSTNMVVSSVDALFKTARAGKMYEDEYETYELTDEAKTTYLGTDGTQVGIYGGIAPYTPTPSNPQITRFNVAQKATADGKLSVDIAVNGAE